QSHCAVGRIRYDCLDPQAIPGTLVYIKSSLTGDESSDVLNYATRNTAFPHQPTSDQFFNESQFESYRALGQHVAHAVFGDAVHGLDELNGVGDHIQRRVARRLFADLVRRWFSPPPRLDEMFFKSVRAFADLQADLRSDNNLRDLSLG